MAVSETAARLQLPLSKMGYGVCNMHPDGRAYGVADAIGMAFNT